MSKVESLLSDTAVPPRVQAEAMTILRNALRPTPEAAISLCEQWVKRAYWTAAEATMLSLGLNPEIPPALVERLSPADWTQVEDRLDLINRKFPGDRVEPMALLNWEQATDIGVVPELVAAIARRNPANKKALRPTDVAKIDRTLEKMVLAMAIEKYGYDPRKSKGAAAKSIAGAVTKLGLTVSEGSVLTRLRAAHQNASADSDIADAISNYFDGQTQLGK